MAVFEDSVIIGRESEKKDDTWIFLSHIVLGASLKVTTKIDPQKAATSKWALKEKASKVKTFPIYFVQAQVLSLFLN